MTKIASNSVRKLARANPSKGEKQNPKAPAGKREQKTAKPKGRSNAAHAQPTNESTQMGQTGSVNATGLPATTVEEMMSKLRKPTAAEIKKMENISSMGTLDPMNPDIWKSSQYVATEDLKTVPGGGSAAVQILIPEGIKHLGGNLGHSQLLFEEGPMMLTRNMSSSPNFSHLRLPTPSELNQALESGADAGLLSTIPFYIAKEDFVLQPMTGASVVGLIVPEGVNVTGNPGHIPVTRLGK